MISDDFNACSHDESRRLAGGKPYLVWHWFCHGVLLKLSGAYPAAERPETRMLAHVEHHALSEGRMKFRKMSPAPLSHRAKRLTNSPTAGFTLVEILVVITIIGLVMALVGPRVLNYLADSKIKAAKIQIDSFSSALDLFFLDTGRFPTGSEGLGALVRPTTGIASWNGPYLKGGTVPNDPWGKPYVYRAPGEHGAYDIVSYGADGQEGGTGTAADIASWSR